jgi:hypothetical protein
MEVNRPLLALNLAPSMTTIGFQRRFLEHCYLWRAHKLFVPHKYNTVRSLRSTGSGLLIRRLVGPSSESAPRLFST